MHHLYKSNRKAENMNIIFMSSKASVNWLPTFVFSQVSAGCVMDTRSMIQKTRRKTRASVMEMIERSIGRSVHFTSLYTLYTRYTAKSSRDRSSTVAREKATNNLEC